MESFLKGLILGFSIAAPVGPIGLLCIRRSLAQGPLHGFFTGLGAATADALYGLIAGLGLASVSSFLVGQQFWMRLLGGIFLLYLGWQIGSANAPRESSAQNSSSLEKSYFTALALTITNPTTILSFVAAFAGMGLQPDQNSAVHMVLGVFLGSAFWWILLSTGTGLFRKKLSPAHITWVNRASGFLIAAFGVAALASLYK